MQKADAQGPAEYRPEGFVRYRPDAGSTAARQRRLKPGRGRRARYERVRWQASRAARIRKSQFHVNFRAEVEGKTDIVAAAESDLRR